MLRPPRVVCGAVTLVILSLLTTDAPRAVAGSADARSQTNQVRWTSPNRQRNEATRNASGHDARLKWKPSQAKPRRLHPDEHSTPMPAPALVAPQVRQAVTAEADVSDEGGKIRLTSLDEPVDDPALDPFQDEVFEEDTDGVAGDELEESGDLEEETEEPLAENGEFDADEVAQRSGDRDPSDLPDELRLDLSDELPLPRVDSEYAQAGPGEPERCPSPRDMKPIDQISHRIAAEPGLFPQECALSDYEFQPRNFKPVTFTWKASALCHKPLYFQQPKLERYGHTFGLLTPIISVGHFFVMVPCLPYNMGLEPPWECVYPLGWYRPGDCAPYTLGPLPLSLRGAASQAVITTGLWFLFQ